MYQFEYFTERDIQKVEEIIQNNPFAVVVGIASNGFPVATQLPLELIRRVNGIYLRGHMMKGASHHLALERNNKVMAIFTGPHHYISARWYNKKNVASTWNYVSIQASGNIHFTDEYETIKILEEITDMYEKADSPSSFSKLNETYISEMAKYVAGFEIKIEKMENVFKLSQNHPIDTRLGIINALEEKNSENATAIATLMKARL